MMCTHIEKNNMKYRDMKKESTISFFIYIQKVRFLKVLDPYLQYHFFNIPKYFSSLAIILTTWIRRVGVTK